MYRGVHAHAAGQFEWVYCCAKQHSEPGSHPHNKRGAKADEITLTPRELIDRIAKLVPTPRARTGIATAVCWHRTRHSGLRWWRWHRAQRCNRRRRRRRPSQPASTDAGEGALEAGKLLPTQAGSAQPEPPKRPAHWLWAVLMARI